MNTRFSGNWIFAQGWEYLRWSVSVLKKVAAIVPGYTGAVICASLVSQISLLLAFFLPLKIVLLIATPGIPRYFPAYFANYDRDALALWLGVAAAGFYVLYLIGNRVMEVSSERGAELLLRRSRKLTLFANQEWIAKQAYQRFSVSIAALLFAGLGLLGFAFLYPALAGFLIGLLLLYLLGISVAGQNEELRDWITKRVNGITEVLAAVFFLAGCGFIVLDFVLGEGVNIIIAIICLLLSRQIAQRLAAAVNDAITLTQQKPSINALFFHSKVLAHSLTADRQQGFWSLLNKVRRDQWLAEVFIDVVDVPITHVESRWHQTGPRGVAGLDVKIEHEGKDGDTWYFVKLFDARQRAQAMHEATLLGDRRVLDLPAPRLLTTVAVEGYQCLIFEATPDGRLEPGPTLRKTMQELVLHSWQVEPPETMVNVYRRSKPLLADRIDDNLIYKMRIAVNTDQQANDVAEFEARLNDVTDVLAAMPLFVYNPDIKAYSINVDTDGEAVVNHWGNWSLEPIGAGWPNAAAQLQVLEKCLTAAAENNERLANVPVHHARLAALMFTLDRFSQQEDYVAAIELLPEVMACLESDTINIGPLKETGTSTS